MVSTLNSGSGVAMVLPLLLLVLLPRALGEPWYQSMQLSPKANLSMCLSDYGNRPQMIPCTTEAPLAATMLWSWTPTGLGGFLMINVGTGRLLRHESVQLGAAVTSAVLSRSLEKSLWTFNCAFDTYCTLRPADNSQLNLDVWQAEEFVKEGAQVVLWFWKEEPQAANQLWYKRAA